VILTQKELQGEIEIGGGEFSAGPMDCSLAVLDIETMEVVYRYHGVAESSEEIEYRKKDGEEFSSARAAIEFDLYFNANKHLQNAIGKLYSVGR
jgi:hypothetical protein